MYLPPRTGGLLLAAVLTAAILPAGAAQAAPAPAERAPAARSAQPDRTITLVTGDRLAISADGAQRVTSLPSPGRSGTRFVSRTVKGHLQVVPEDALPMLTAGTLDPRLFDVTQLLADGFGDDTRSTLPLIVSTGGRALRSVAAAENVRNLWAVGAQAMTQDRSSAATMWNSLATPGMGLRAGVTRIWLDGYLKVNLDVSVPQIGAPTAWAAGYTGDGIGVGVIDTGVDVTHPDLKDAVAENKSFLDTPGGPPGPPGPPGPGGPGGPPPEDDKDYAGHGTHVASTIAGRGTASDGRYKGVAPAVKIYSAKVCNRFGQCPESATLAGMQWAAEKKLRVVNMSLGHPNSPGLDIMEEAIQNLTAQYGTLFVVASGNDNGPANSPSTAPDALSVGAVDKQDNIAEFSSGGSIFGELAAKPEVTAPGVAITAAQSAFKQPIDGKAYWTASGTSMATPHVAGALALLAQQHPEWTAAQLKAALVSSAKPNPKIAPAKQGAGRIDLARAIGQKVTADPAGLSFGEHDWPHQDDKPVSHTITYSNSGTAPITLALSSTVTGWDGTPAAAELISLSPADVTVPAGGTADVTVTVKPSAKTDDGYFGGTVTAAGGDTTVRTPWVLYKDIEAYNLTITNLDRTGNVPAQARTQFYAHDGTNWGGVTLRNGVGTARLAKGTYSLSTLLREGSGDTAELTSLLAPTVNLDRDTTITMDGRIAKPLSVTVPDSGATQYFGHVHHTVAFGGLLALGEDLTGPNFDRMYTGQIGPDDKAVTTSVSGAWAKPDADGSISDSPYIYNLAWHTRGGHPNGFERKVTPRDLARVDTTFDSEVTGSQGGLISERRAVGDQSRGWGVYAGIKALPAHRTMYYNSDGNTEFRTQFNSGVVVDGTPTPLSFRISPFTAYQAGVGTTDRWNNGVYGPAFPTPQENMGDYDRQVEISRTGNRITFWPSLISDSSGQTADAVTDQESLTVTRNGEAFYTGSLITDAFNVPAGEATYRATTALTRSAPAELSTNVTTSWTFRSGTTGKTQPLPVAAIRFEPKLDRNNVAPVSGGPFALPIVVQPQAGATVGTTKTLTVEASYDHGKTWAPAWVHGSGNRWIASVLHPEGHGFVSLRATAASGAGNMVEQTIIRAYKY
jgi:subtilisin family serine protease